jgi:AcrR family transcriptional regulator
MNLKDYSSLNSLEMKTNKPEIRDLILDKAIEIIVQRGIKGLTMEDLASASGVAKSTLFKIVGSKEKLVETVVIDQIERSLSSLTAIIGESKDYRGTARRILKEHPLFLSDSLKVPAPEIFLEYPTIRKKVEQFQKRATSTVIGFIEKGQKEGHIRDDVEPAFLCDLIGAIADHYFASGLRDEALKNALIKAFHCLREGVRRGDW